AVAKSTNLPIMIYNVPGRTGVNIVPSTVEKLAEIDTIVAIKEASGDLDQISEVVNRCGDRIRVLAGDDSLFTPILAVGGVGVVSVIANIIPKDLKDLFTTFKSGDIANMQKRHHHLLRLYQAMFYEPNPAPVKTAMNLMGKDVGDLRLPLAPMTESNKSRLVEVLKTYGLIN
nr:4-hydroxy-tetrahydrodipicolinate synthase [candidate division KSB1 bacterium]